MSCWIDRDHDANTKFSVMLALTDLQTELHAVSSGQH